MATRTLKGEQPAEALPTEIDWDSWRENYDSFSFDDQRRFYRLVADLYPVQQSFDPLLASNAFDAIHGADLDVVELGGWDGKLAQNMLHRTDVATWTNYDLVEVPTACSQPGYQMVVLDDYLWAHPIRGDVFVATHMIEHIRFRELLELFDALRVSWVYLEAPLSKYGSNWDGYTGSHILEVGWNEVGLALTHRGYRSKGARGLWKHR